MKQGPNSIQLVTAENTQPVSASSCVLAFLLLCLLPCLGVYLGQLTGLLPPADYWRRYSEFPPQTLYLQHAAFSWPVFVVYALLAAICVLLLLSQLKHFYVYCFRQTKRPGVLTLSSLLLLIFCWFLAWQRWDWAQPVQRHSFLFLWLSYILLLNAYLFECHSACPLTRAPLRFLLSFPLSGVFWWSFEFLNRFTQNWLYLNVQDFSVSEYAVFASLSFSTVLPALGLTEECLRLGFLKEKRASILLLLAGRVWLSLLLISLLLAIFLPIYPDYLFAALWLLPLTFIYSLEGLKNRRGISLRPLPLWAISGLLCGLLWELWNYHSLAKWVYHVPFVEYFYIFEMPLLGYAGYLPFGLLCGLLLESFCRKR